MQWATSACIKLMPHQIHVHCLSKNTEYRDVIWSCRHHCMIATPVDILYTCNFVLSAQILRARHDTHMHTVLANTQPCATSGSQFVPNSADSVKMPAKCCDSTHQHSHEPVVVYKRYLPVQRSKVWYSLVQYHVIWWWQRNMQTNTLSPTMHGFLPSCKCRQTRCMDSFSDLLIIYLTHI